MVLWQTKAYVLLEEGRQSNLRNKDSRWWGPGITPRLTIQGCLSVKGTQGPDSWKTKDLSWKYLWAEGMPTRDPQLGMSLASLEEGKEPWCVLTEGVVSSELWQGLDCEGPGSWENHLNIQTILSWETSITS